MILCEWDASEGHPGQSCLHLYARILSTSFISVSIFSVWCYSSVLYLNGPALLLLTRILRTPDVGTVHAAFSLLKMKSLST